MNWKRITLISLAIFTVGIITISFKAGTQDELNFIKSIGAILVFFSLLFPLVVKVWERKHTRLSKAILGILAIFFLFLLAAAIMPKTSSKTDTGKKLPAKTTPVNRR